MPNKNDGLEINSITSVYGKNNSVYNYWVEKGRLWYANTSKIENLPHAQRLLLPRDKGDYLTEKDFFGDDKNNLQQNKTFVNNKKLSLSENTSDTDSQNEDIGEVIRKRYGSAVTDEQIQAFKDMGYKTPDLFGFMMVGNLSIGKL